MADTALNEEEIIEYFDPDDVLQEKVAQLATLVKKSQHMVAYTGAGISTAAGISDFRGPEGVWTLRAKGLAPKGGTSKTKAKPTVTHMALVQLMNSDHLKYLVSQNCDGLHIKSGIPPAKISEVHGNTNVEACAGCGLVVYRGFPVRKTRNKQLLTGRRCPKCSIPLRYTTVAFGQSLPDLSLARAEAQSEKADLAVCLGTSMRVRPACDLPILGRQTSKSHKLVIVNLQETPYDNKCAIRIFARVDNVLELLMKHLELDIPDYEDTRFSENATWLNQFPIDYKFRSPDTHWFKGSLDEDDHVLESATSQNE